MVQENANNFIEKLKFELEFFSDENQISKVNNLISEVDQNIVKESNTDRIEHIEDLIQNAIREFEASHPKTTLLLNDFLTTLSSIGI